MASRWDEVGDRVMVARYPYLDQNIGLIIGSEVDVVIDTRSTPAQGREILDDIGRVSSNPVGAVINTHGHSDHAFGNSVFRPAAIWGHIGCPAFIRATGERQRAAAMQLEPMLAEAFADVVLDPPEHLVDMTTVVEFGGRRLELLILGRAHTDHDLVIGVPDAGVAFAGDMVVKADAQYFDDSFPLDWPDTLESLASVAWEVLVTGHGGDADRSYLAAEISRHRALVGLATEGYQDQIPWEDLVGKAPYPTHIARTALARPFSQLETRLVTRRPLTKEDWAHE